MDKHYIVYISSPDIGDEDFLAIEIIDDKAVLVGNLSAEKALESVKRTFNPTSTGN